MTAIVCLVGPKDARLLTDGLTVHLYPGAASPPMSKVTLFDAFPGAMALRGALSILDYFSEHLAKASTFDAAVIALEEGVACRQREGRSASYQLVLVGWSEAEQRPAGYFVSGVPTGPAGLKAPLQLHPIERIMAIPRLPGLWDFSRSDDPEQNFPTLMDRIVETDRTGTIGAFCELTIVSQHGASSEIVKEYGPPRPLDRRHLRGQESTLPDVFQRALLIGSTPEPSREYVPLCLFR
jgi:hypothetical protein